VTEIDLPCGMLKQIWQKITGYQAVNPKSSLRQTAKELGVSKDMVYRQGKRAKKRRQFSESEFWDSEAGQNFIKRLIVSAIYTFGIKGGIGAGRIADFMKQIRLSTHAGISETSIYRMMKEIEVSILKYKELIELELGERASTQLEELEVVLGLDETWLDNMLLVCQELSSGYFFLKLRLKEETPKVGGSPSKKVLPPSDSK